MFLVEKFQRKHFNRTNKNTLAPWYVTGLAEGAASFTYSRSGNTIGLYFALKTTEQDKALLEAVRDFFGCGTIYEGSRPSGNAGLARAFLYYRVARGAELLKVIEHFERFPLVGKKAQAFSVWKDMVRAKARFRRPDTDALNEGALRLSELSSRGS